MFVGVLWWDLSQARQDVDAAEKRGADPGIIATLRITLDQCERDGDDDSAQAVGTYAARLGPAGAYSVQTGADVVVQSGLNAAETVKAATTSGFHTVSVLLLVAVAVLAVRELG